MQVIVAVNLPIILVDNFFAICTVTDLEASYSSAAILVKSGIPRPPNFTGIDSNKRSSSLQELPSHKAGMNLWQITS